LEGLALWPAQDQPGEMISNQQYQRLMSEYEKTGKIVVSAMKADVHPQTARKYVEAAQQPAELQAKLSPGGSKPATYGRIKTSHSEAGSSYQFIHLLQS
jgi:hypothetical protein